MNISEVWVATNTKDVGPTVIKFLESRGYFGWKFVLVPSLRRNALGLCNYTDKTISVLHALMHKIPEIGIKTVIHEIAHVLSPAHGHGPKWVKCAEELGLENPSGISNESLSDLPREVQRVLYTHRLCVLFPDRSIELLHQFTNNPRSLVGKFVDGRPETRGRLRWLPL